MAKPTSPSARARNPATPTAWSSPSWCLRRPYTPINDTSADFIQVDRGPIGRWSAEHFPSDRVVFSSSSHNTAFEAIRAGMGMGLCPTRIAMLDSDLVQVHPPEPDWNIPLWLVTHVDLHRTAKVQAILHLLRAPPAQSKD